MDIDLSKVFVANVQRVLNEKDLSQKDLAKKLNIKASGVSKVLADDANPTIERISDIARALETKPWQLIQPEKDKSWAEKLIPQDILNKVARLSPEKRESFFTNVNNLLELAGVEDCDPPKKASGS